jgi:hypothetical protein
MEFNDLIGREFTVRWAEESAKHAKDDIVTFHGAADKVEIKCKRYADGKYNGGTISDGATYTITVTENPDGTRQITFTPNQGGSGGIGGSWTANDTPPGPENG